MKKELTVLALACSLTACTSNNYYGGAIQLDNNKWNYVQQIKASDNLTFMLTFHSYPNNEVNLKLNRVEKINVVNGTIAYNTIENKIIPESELIRTTNENKISLHYTLQPISSFAKPGEMITYSFYHPSKKTFLKNTARTTLLLGTPFIGPMMINPSGNLEEGEIEILPE